MQAPYRGTRGGEKARKRQFFEVSDQVRSAQRNLFRTVPWRRIEFSEATQALSQAFAAIAANPNDPTEPGWAVVATFNTALLAGCCAPGAPAAAPLGAGRTRPTGGGGSMRSAAALGSVFSGSSTSPSSGAAKPMPISLPLSSKPTGDEERARRFGGEAGGAKRLRRHDRCRANT